MDFNVKKLMGDMVENTGTFLTRAVQMTEEALYSGEKTTIDPQLEALQRQADAARNWTTRMVKDTEHVLTPNPGYRVEDFLMEKIDKKRPVRMSNTEILGQGLIEAGTEFGPTSAYGSMLIKVGQNDLKLGQTEREFVQSAVASYVEPLNRFLDNEVRVAMKERKTLENKRLDLDAAKNRLRKARSMSSTPSKDGTDPRVLIQQAEREVLQAQTEFTQQAEIVRVQLDIVMVCRDRHIEHLKSLISAQTTYYARCHQLMLELGREIEIMPIHNLSLNESFSIDSTDDGTLDSGQMRGKVMLPYVAQGPGELSLFPQEALIVEETDDSEYFMAIKGNSRGRVPKSCVLLL